MGKSSSLHILSFVFIRGSFFRLISFFVIYLESLWTGVDGRLPFNGSALSIFLAAYKNFSLSLRKRQFLRSSRGDNSVKTAVLLQRIDKICVSVCLSCISTIAKRAKNACLDGKRMRSNNKAIAGLV
jgi:hypothetical protein